MNFLLGQFMELKVKLLNYKLILIAVQKVNFKSTHSYGNISSI